MRHLFVLSLITLAMIGFALSSCSTKSTRPEDGQVAAPVFSPGEGSYDFELDVLISCATPNAVIRYTLDNSEPSTSSELYSGLLRITGSTIIKAKAFKAGWISSAVTSATYYLDTVSPPVINPPGGIYQSPQAVSMVSETPDARIHYTLDGTVPTELSPLYTSPVTISSGTVLKARAFVQNKTPSPVVTEQYGFELAPPVLSQPGGSYSVPQNISITSATAGATIKYTLDASEPDENSFTYTQPVNIAANTILKVKVFKANWIPSQTLTAIYRINISDQMVLVQGGTFHNGFANVTLSPYFISRHEITQFDWYMVFFTDPSYYPEDDPSVYANLPVESISWLEAIAYCNLRSISENYTPCYSYGAYGTNPAYWPEGWNTDAFNHTSIQCNWNANGYRLPTDMEWMYAASGGNQSGGYTYSGSNNVDDVAWYVNNAEGITGAIGSKQPNELGIFDMSGNVWEFCWDI
ncbi:MAG: chitobiase/beta-hexosaminidase C-terminal domain-containing protein, partial [Candidatus Cloacimonadaceae bacterium]|nr:chitobiase/beta-hexosaminidase C-terminal domain-containing protein [Candidatus Cloacimonadaceae bacterium]